MVAGAPTIVSLTPAVFHLPEAVNQASSVYGRQPIVPRGPRLKPLMMGVRDGIVKALGADGYEAIMLTGSGSTAMAAVLGSCLAPTDRLLVVRNGAYGDRLATFAKRLGQPLVELETPYGEHPDLEAIERLCQAKKIDALAMVYGCTSSCGLNPIEKVAAIARRHQIRFFVDGVSALFVEKIDFDKLGAVAWMGSCNKGLHSHPNLTFVLVKNTSFERLSSLSSRVPSLELSETWAKQRDGAHPYTIDPMSLCQVQAALDALKAEGGVAGRHAIYRERCALLRKGYADLGLMVARWPGMPLQSIGTALQIPKGARYLDMAERLVTESVDGHVFEIYAAQGKLSDQLFRVFHMGAYPLDVYRIFLRALKAVLPPVRL